MKKKILAQVFMLFTVTILLAGRSAWAAVATYNFSGAVTYLSNSNTVLMNGPGERTAVNGTFVLDNATNLGQLNIGGFIFQGSTWTTNTAGFALGTSNQLFLDYSASWSGNSDIKAALVMDTTGFFGGTGAVPASDSAVSAGQEIGPAPIATTTKDWNPLVGTGTVTDDGIGGGFMSGGGSLDAFSFNLDFLTMTLDSCEVGGCTSNPVMPSSANPGAGFFLFDGTSGAWYDPPTTFGYEYTMTDGSLFTDILNFPTGFDSPFQVEADGNVLGLFGPSESVDFVALLGGGVSQFRITGLSPATDPSDPAAFPIQLAFNTNTASFSMQTLSAVPVPAAIWLFGSGLLGLVGMARRKKAT